jgi:predicted ATPase
MPPPECATGGEGASFSLYSTERQACGGAVGDGVAREQLRNPQHHRMQPPPPPPPLSGPHFLSSPSSSTAAPGAAHMLTSVHIEDSIDVLHLQSKDKKAVVVAAEAATPAGDDPFEKNPNNNNNNNRTRRRDTSPQAPRRDLPFWRFALCDREKEARQLTQALDRGCCGCRGGGCSLDRPEASNSRSRSGSPHRSTGRIGELVLITGPSGCGKTCLVESVVHSALQGSNIRGIDQDDEGDGDGDEGIDHDANSSGVLISGKFDQLERREQYYAIIQALTEYALILSRTSSPSLLRSIRKALAPQRETVKIVADLVLEILTLLDFDDSDHESNKERRAAAASSLDADATAASPEGGGAVARERLQLGVQRFFSAVCSPTRPVVLFLDDLQWAEPASLDLLASLFADPIPGLVVIGACRDNEVDPASYLCVILRELEARDVAITQIVVSNVKQPALVSAFGESFGLAQDKATMLARILYEHTAGNMFFVTQLVQYLVGEGFLYKAEADPVRWKFDSEQRIRGAIRDATDEVSLLAIVIQKQERDVQDTLMVASCLGAEFSELVLKAAVTFDVAESLQIAERMAFLKRSAHDRSTWRFVHDRIQESAYSLIPPHEREQVHLRIGRILWGSLSESDLDVHAHVVLKQLRLGVRLITDPTERELLATLLLRAGEMAARASVHVTAQEYVSLGIQLLEKRHWRDQYELSLALYNAAAEIEYCLANFERMDALWGDILKHARSPKDKIRTLTAQIYALGSRNKLDEAIDAGLETLRSFFGERLPTRPSVLSILLELRKTRRLLRGRSDDSLLALPPMSDSHTFASIRIMSLLMVYVVLCRPMLAPIMAMRIVQHSLRRGLCSMSGNGFACYGLVLATFFNEVETGIRYGKVALRIVERFDALDQLARTSTVAHCFCLSHTEPLPTLLQPLWLAHRVGLGAGDIEHSLMAAGMYSVVAVYSFRHLSDVSSDVSSFLALTVAYRHSGTDLLFRPLAQFIECLQGGAPDPSKLSGTYLEWDAALRVAKETNHGAAASSILMCKLMLECMFRRMDDAEVSANELSRLVSGLESAPCYIRATAWLYLGLAYAAQSHKDGAFVRKRVRRAKQLHRQLVQLSRFSDLNYGGKALLLGAEIMVATGSYHQGLLQYEAAVALAKRAEAWGDAALACERLSSSLQAKGRSEESLIYLNQASRYYELWGATAKVTELQSAILDKSARLEPQ